MSRQKARPLAPGYSSEVDTISEREWHEELQKFDDANIYQTWSYGEVTWGLHHSGHWLLRKNGEIVALAQVRFARIPILNAGIAYMYRGPLWRRKGMAPDPETLRQTLRALRNQYVCSKGLLLRLAPMMFANEDQYGAQVFCEENFKSKMKYAPKMTILMNLSSPIEELRAGMQRNWRRNLKAAEGRGLTVIEGETDDLFKAVIDVYRQMVQRKGFLEPNDIEKFRRVNSSLPDSLKMKVAVCRSSEGIAAGLIWSEIGDTAIELFAATSTDALANGAAYLLRWHLVERLKQRGFRSYNLNGINQEQNPGCYHFKAGLAGKAGTETAYLGVFESKGNALSTYCANGGQDLLDGYRSIRAWARAKRRELNAPA